MTNTITRQDLEAAIASGSVVVLEILPSMYFETEHLPGARNLPLDDLGRVGEVVATRDTPVVTYCSNTECQNSGIAAAKLEELGYTNVRKYAGGKQDWIEAGLPVETGAAEVR